MGQENVPELPSSTNPPEVGNYESKVRPSKHGFPPGTFKCTEVGKKKRDLTRAGISPDKARRRGSAQLRM